METDLPNQMAGLDIVEMDAATSSPPAEGSMLPPMQSRVLRKRKSIAQESNTSTNRRVNMKPRKCVIVTENADPKQIEALYLNKKVKTISQTLETIFEEPKSEKCDVKTLIGGRKVKRLLTFPICSQYTKDKVKKRRAKIKKLLGNKTFLNRKKMPMQMFLDTIKCLELDETEPDTNSPEV